MLLPTTLASLSPGVMLLNCSTAPRDSATNTKKTSWKGAPKWERSNRSVVKAGLHRNANTNAACENDANVHVGKFVDCSAFVEAANRTYINVLYTNSLWCTNSRRTAFGCSPNVRHTAKCCLPRLRNTSTSNIRIVFVCRIRVLFVFRCKRGLKMNHGVE